MWKRSILSVLLLLLVQQPVWSLPASQPVKSQQYMMMSRFYAQAAMQMASQGSLKQAAVMLKQVVILRPESLDALLWYTDFLRAQGEYNEAIAACEAALPYWQKDATVYSALHYRLSLLLDETKQTQKAVDMLKQAKMLYPGQAPAAFDYDLGVLYAKLEQYEETLFYSRQTLQRSPQSAAAWNNAGYSLAKLGRYSEAYEAIQKALRLEPKNPNTQDSMGYVLFGLKRYEEAIPYFQQAVLLDPGMTESFLYLGKTYEALKQWDLAINAYQQFQRLTTDMAQSERVGQAIQQIKLRAFLKEPTHAPVSQQPSALPTQNLIPAVKPSLPVAQ